MTEALPSITDFFVCADYCSRCGGCGTVCSEHPDKPWYPMVTIEDGACDCGAEGMPCREELRGGSSDVTMPAEVLGGMSHA